MSCLGQSSGGQISGLVLHPPHFTFDKSLVLSLAVADILETQVDHEFLKPWSALVNNKANVYELVKVLTAV